MNLKSFILVTLLLPLFSYAQTPDHKCSIDHQTADLIKQRLMNNRANFSKQQVQTLLSNRNTTYIPVIIHNVANSNGQGRTPEIDILNFMCGLNAIYADQDVQFYFYSPIRYRTSNAIDIDAFSFSSRVEMAGAAVNGVMNIFIGRSSSNPRASYYQGQGDFIFLLQQQMSSAAKTEAHEIGHFFTLAHTFNGWEGVSAEASYANQNAPNAISGRAVERATRTGVTANCQTAADGFCDTPADYYSDRTACPYSPTVRDPLGDAITPDESNIMSYAFDNCVNNFTAEQKTAIIVDIAARNWLSQTPNNTTVVTGTPSVVSPANNQAAFISNPTVKLDWSNVTGATWYYIEVYGTSVPGLWLPNTNDLIYKGLIYNSNSEFDLPTGNLVAGKYYAWRVKALNETSTCASFNGYSKFEASTATSISALPLEQQMSLKINNNPITTSYIPMTIYSAEEIMGSIRIYGMDGREALSLTKQNLNAGETIVQLPAADLANGIYVAVVNTERGTIQKRLIIQR